MKHLLCLSLALLIALPALAADPVYEIELLAFQRQVEPATHGEEEGRAPAHRPRLEDGFSLDMIGGLPLGASSLRLNRAAARLSRQAAYKVILHEAWRQPVATRASAPFMLLQAGAALPGADGEPRRQLEGLLRLYRDPQLYLQSDLLLRKLVKQAVAASLPAAPLAAEQALGEYSNRDLRRIKEGEIAYIDHPLFGLLVQVRKAG